MGMYDDVNYECVCPRCHNKVTGFQSKDGPCELLKLEPEEVDNFYSHCRVCGAWLEFDAARQEPKRFVMRPISKERSKRHGT